MEKTLGRIGRFLTISYFLIIAYQSAFNGVSPDNMDVIAMVSGFILFYVVRD